MAVRDGRGPGRRRAARGRAGFVGLAVALYAAAAVLATWPAVEHVGSRFLAHPGAARHGDAEPGDYLQTGWNLWLFGHQLTHGRAPWLDPYSFRPELSPRANFQGLVFGLPYWPLYSLLGAVLAWNVFTLLTYVGAGGATCAWLRALGLPRSAALVGGLAFALAPYRIAQSTGHLLGPISLFLPLALLGLEKRRPLLAGAALAAIPLSGQVNLALGAVPLFVAYALVRRGRGGLLDALPGFVGAVAAAELVNRAVIHGSAHATGRSLREVALYSADWDDFLQRHGSGETFVFAGWIVPLLALVGLVALVGARRYWLASLLAAAVAIPVVLALGTNLPTYRIARHVVPGLKVARVPERLLPIACLALAALVAYAVALLPRVSVSPRWRAVTTGLLLALVAADLHVVRYGSAAEGDGNSAYAAIRALPPGRLLDLPVFLPDDQGGSTYLYYDQTAQRERPTGYSTTVPRAADSTARRLRHLNCGTWPAALGHSNIHYVAVHHWLFRYPRCPARAEAALRRHGFRPLVTSGAVTMWTDAA